MTPSIENNTTSQKKNWDNLFQILKPEKGFYWVVAIYGITISLFTLAAPISVQTLINTVANTAQISQVIVLALVLFGLLLISGLLYALQKYIMELFERRFFARIVSDVVMQNIYADIIYFRSINRTELINRYFDIMTIQKNVPSLLTGGFALILQSIVGLVVVSFYHPVLFAFNIFFILFIYAIWRIWGYKAIRTGHDLSNAKYNVAEWLEEIAHANADFKSHDRILYSVKKSDDLTQEYVEKRKRHFSHFFKQVLGLLFAYAFFSSLLLGLGGYLVIIGQLSLGQLVAAELILTAIFSGISQAGRYLDMIYELVPAAEKISYFYQIPLEEDEGGLDLSIDNFDLTFKNVRCEYRGELINYDLKINTGEKILAGVASHVLQEYFMDLLRAYRTPDRGQILVGDKDIGDLNPQVLRDAIYVIDEPHLLETTIKEYLCIANPDVNKVEIMDILDKVDLVDIVENLPDGLNTKILNTGYPLSNSESIRLKLAGALLAKPKVLILTEHFDVIGYRIRQKLFRFLVEQNDMTLVYFTNRRDIEFFENYMHLGWGGDSFHNTITELREAGHESGDLDDGGI